MRDEDWPFPLNECQRSTKPVQTFNQWWKRQGFHLDKEMKPLEHEFKTCWEEAQRNK